MLVVHVVLLNLLIAIMQHSHAQATEEAKLVAKYRRALLVLAQEDRISAARAEKLGLHPQWLHLLEPQTLSRGEADRGGVGAAHGEQALEQLHASLTEQTRQLEQLLRKHSSGCSARSRT